LELCGESYDEMSEQRSKLPRIRKTMFFRLCCDNFGFGFVTLLLLNVVG